MSATPPLSDVGRPDGASQAGEALHGLSGPVRDPDFFQLPARPQLDLSLIDAVLTGQLAGCFFKQIVDHQVSQQVARNFWAHPHLQTRNDDVPAWVLGTYHYGRPLGTYLDLAQGVRQSLRDVFAGSRDVFHEVMGALGAHLQARGVTLRVARHGDREASPFVMRSWRGAGTFALEPHDDGAQLRQQAQAGFEIQAITEAPVVAMNICLENDGDGQLHYWNVEPNEADRRAFGVEETGYPYPLRALDGVPKLVVPVERGDVYFFNGRFVHAVQALGTGHGYRSTISCLLGFRDPETVIYWA
ncbi:MAG TPA: hypothetical protein VNE16_06380 [Vicinamibacterales bacterium]|nr:hypothetical protein [Vicinamibacterales bacterium]